MTPGWLLAGDIKLPSASAGEVSFWPWLCNIFQSAQCSQCWNTS